MKPNLNSALRWAALVVLVLCAAALAVALGVWAANLTQQQAVEAVQTVAIVALVVLLFAHDHQPKPRT